jgi:hypothetical protein
MSVATMRLFSVERRNVVKPKICCMLCENVADNLCMINNAIFLLGLQIYREIPRLVYNELWGTRSARSDLTARQHIVAASATYTYNTRGLRECRQEKVIDFLIIKI